MALDFTWQDGERVMFLGDMATEDPQGYTRLVPAMVTARYPDRRIDYIPHGVGGNRVGDVVERLDRDVFDSDPAPSWITLSIGINDVAHDGLGTPLGRFRELYLELLLRLRDTKATIACLTTAVISENLNSNSNTMLVGYNDAIREIAFENGAQVVDVNAVFREAIQRAQASNPDFRYTTDGMNLNMYGQYLLAMTLLNALNFSLRSSPSQHNEGTSGRRAA